MRGMLLLLLWSERGLSWVYLQWRFVCVWVSLFIRLLGCGWLCIIPLMIKPLLRECINCTVRLKRSWLLQRWNYFCLLNFSVSLDFYINFGYDFDGSPALLSIYSKEHKSYKLREEIPILGDQTFRMLLNKDYYHESHCR